MLPNRHARTECDGRCAPSISLLDQARGKVADGKQRIGLTDRVAVEVPVLRQERPEDAQHRVETRAQNVVVLVESAQRLETEVQVRQAWFVRALHPYQAGQA